MSDNPHELLPQSSRRPWWVLAVVVGYALLVLAMLAAPWVLGRWDGGDLDGLGWPLSIATAVWLVCLGGLMFVPVQMGRLRRVPRGSIWVPLILTGFLAGTLAFAAGMAVWELSDAELRAPLLGAIVMGGVGVWAMWMGVFYLMSRKQGQTRVALTLHRWLLAGNVLELLIAVPAHVVVRRRTNCCAGIATGSAIALGVLVIVLAFGPSVVLLYVQRWRKIRISKVEERRGFEVEIQPASPDSSKM